MIISCTARNKIVPESVCTEVSSFENNAFYDGDSIQFNFEGSWILKSYLKSIAESKGIYKFRDPKHIILGFSYESNPNEESKNLINGYTLHEGGYTFPIKIITIPSSGTILKEDLSRENSISIPNHGFTIIPISQNEVNWKYDDSITVHSYIRTKLDLDIEINKILFVGEYFQSNGKEVIFEANGVIKGLAGFSNYKVIYDFGLGIDFDAIVLFKDGIGNWNDGVIYKYIFEGNQLNIQRIDSNWDNLEHTLTSEIIQLKKNCK